VKRVAAKLFTFVFHPMTHGTPSSHNRRAMFEEYEADKITPISEDAEDAEDNKEEEEEEVAC
jgi:hypothetical protein